MKDQINVMVAIIRQSRDDAIRMEPVIAAHFEGIAARVEYALFLFENHQMSETSLVKVLEMTTKDYEMAVAANQLLYAAKTTLN